MAPLLAFAMLQQDVPERTHATLPSVLFESTDVRQALRILGRQGLIGITVDPGVRGPVTVSLRNVEWEVALQNVTRQVDATYRFERGWLYVVPYDIPDTATRPSLPEPIVRDYNALAKAVATGRGDDLRHRLAPGFELRNATETKRGEPAYRGVVEAFRTAKGFRVERTWPRKEGEDALLVYARFGANPICYRDAWRKVGDRLRLTSREETVRNPVRRFRDVLLSEVLRAVFDDAGVSVRLDPALDRRVTVDLPADGTFETLLQWLVRSADLTYRIEGGVYEIVRRDP